MNKSDVKHRDLRPYLREGLLWLGFIALLAAAGVTVVLPELSEDPDASANEPSGSDAGTP